jgi:hypothetical protein
MSKHKQPKNEKHKPRKDLKDYTGEGTNDCQWEASGEILPGDRKDDKFPNPDDKIYPFVANHDKDQEKITMVPELKDADRVYPIKDMQDGNPKMAAHAKSTFEKNVENDAKDLIDTLSKKDGGYMSQIKKLTKEQKEKLVREIVKRRIINFINEQEEPEEPAEPETPDAPDTPDATDTPEPAAAPETPEVAPEPTDEPASPEEPPADTEEPPADTDGAGSDARIDNFVKALEQKPGTLIQVKLLMGVIKKLLNDKNPKQKLQLLAFMKRLIDRSLQKQSPIE